MYSSTTHQHPYRAPHESYLERWLMDRNDFSRNIPLKSVEFDSHLLQAGIYGMTYLASSHTTRDRFLMPEKARETDVHECIHTDWEYETRLLTQWILSGDIGSYDMALLKSIIPRGTHD